MKKILCAIAALSTLIAIPAMAQSTSDAYVNLNLGTGGMDTPQPELKGLAGGSNYRGFVGRISAGYLVGENPFLYGLESGFASYADNKLWFGTDTGNSLTYKAYNIDLLAVMQYRFDSCLSFKGKVGAAYEHQKTVANGLMNPALEDSHGKLLPEISLSSEYAFKNGMTINAAYHYLYGDKPDAVTGLTDQNTSGVNRVASVVMITAGVGFRF